MTHGMSGNVHWWDSVAPALAGLCRVVALDLQGHGDSDWADDGRYDSDLFVGNIEAARRALGWERFILGGHSMGARVALDYVRLHPERVIGLVAVDFLPEFYDSRERFARLRNRPQPVYSDAKMMAERFRLEPPGTLLDRKALSDLARLSLRQAGRGWSWKFDWRSFHFRYESIWPALAHIRVPSLIVRGENSAVLGREAFERVLREIPGSFGADIPRAHHHVPLDSPRELTAAMKDFIAQRCLA